MKPIAFWSASFLDCFVVAYNGARYRRAAFAGETVWKKLIDKTTAADVAPNVAEVLEERFQHDVAQK